MGYFYQLYLCQGIRPSVTEYDNQGGSRKRELDELRRNYTHEKSFAVWLEEIVQDNQ